MPQGPEDLVGQLAGLGRRLGRILIGIFLFLLGVYFVQQIAVGVRGVWQKENAVSERGAGAKKSKNAGDDPTDAARLTTYGFLAQQAAPGSQDDEDVPRARPRSLSPLDRVPRSPNRAQLHLVNKKILLRSYRSFGFDVPPHALRPRIQGYFRSLPSAVNEQADDAGSVEVLLMTQQEFGQLQRHEPGTVAFVTGGVEGNVNWTLPVRPLEAQRFYLVFHNPVGQHGAELIDADFSVSFE